MKIQNFKGIKNKEILFDGKSARVYGENATFKTSISDAYYFVFADCNTALVKNPPITPFGESECESRVELEMRLDDKPLNVAKVQKFKSKEVDGKVTSAITNIYEINSIEKTYANFIADLKDRGINMDDFLILSHVFAFSADTSKQGREKMRSKLFEMVDGITDLDIAKGIDVPDVTTDLENGYKIDEIEQRAKSELRTIKEKYGLNNEIINSRISGMIESKVEGNISDLEKEKVALQGKIDALKADIDGIGNSKAEIERTIASLKKDKADLLAKESSERKKKEADLELKLVRLDTDLSKANSTKFHMSEEIREIEKKISSTEESLENWRDLYKKVQDEVLDEKKLVCPTCNRPLEDKEIDEIKSNFESSKNERMNAYKARGEEAKAEIERLKGLIDDYNKGLEVAKKQVADVEIQMEEIKKELSELPPAPTRTEETDAIDMNIDALEGNLKMSDSDRLNELKTNLDEAYERLDAIVGNIAVIERNSEIDARVEELRTERKGAEIKRANAEKIIDQVETFKKAKNESLSESINKHFKIAQFRLFKVLKNGNIEDDCAILVDGKELNSQLNQSTQVLAFADIVAGLQEFENQNLPIFLDNHALFTSLNDSKIPLECQVIRLIATEGVKEIDIKKEGE